MWLLERTELGVCIALVELFEEKCGHHRSIGMLGYDCHPCHHFGDSTPQIMLNLGSGVPEYHIFLTKAKLFCLMQALSALRVALSFSATRINVILMFIIELYDKMSHPHQGGKIRLPQRPEAISEQLLMSSWSLATHILPRSCKRYSISLKASHLRSSANLISEPWVSSAFDFEQRECRSPFHCSSIPLL